MKTIQQFVIADDLTGSNDTGVHFLSTNDDVVVVVDPAAEITSSLAASTVINTDTRLCTPEQAYQKVRTGIDKYVEFKPKEIYKKVDSTLRGNVGAEIDAVMDAVDFKVACVATATPRNGRTVKNGVCFVNGVRLSKTEMAKDPFTPVSFSDVRKIIAEQSSRCIGLLSLETIRSAFDCALESLTALISSGVEIVVTDAETVEDLRTVRTLFTHIQQPVLYVGSAGLFHATGTPLPVEHQQKALALKMNPKILFVVGSLMETTLSQVNYLQDRQAIQICLLSTENLLNKGNAEIERQKSIIDTAFKTSDIVLLRTDRTQTELTQVASKVGSTLGSIVRQVAETVDIDVMVVTGGDTALNVLKKLRVSSLKLKDEVLPGIPIAEIDIPKTLKPTLFVTKAGSYGDSDALAGVLDYITKAGENTIINTAGEKQ